MSRSLHEIAFDIANDWQPVNYAAKPYLEVMFSLDSIRDRYYNDTGRSIVSYFLNNASQWKGEKARTVKAELRAMLKDAS